jgi:hypothetical protein
VVGGVKKKGRDLAVLCHLGWGFGRDPTYAEYCGLVLNRAVVESRRAWEYAIGGGLGKSDQPPAVGFFQALLDEEDEDAAVAMATQVKSAAMMARQLAQRGAE